MPESRHASERRRVVAWHTRAHASARGHDEGRTALRSKTLPLPAPRLWGFVAGGDRLRGRHCSLYTVLAM